MYWLIEGFIRFYTNLNNIEEKAQYVRKQSRPNDTSKPTVRKINSYYTSINQPIHEQRRSNYGNQPNKGNGSKGKPRNDYQRNRNVARSSGNGGPSTPRYCIFCETNTHDTGFCKIAKYTADYKSQQCQKHNACYMCFKTSEHKANTCPKIMKCLFVQGCITLTIILGKKSMIITKRKRNQKTMTTKLSLLCNIFSQ